MRRGSIVMLIALSAMVAVGSTGCFLCPASQVVDERSGEGGDPVDAVDGAVTLLSIETLEAVQNGGSPPSFALSKPHVISAIMTYHWNDATGQEPGTIALEATDGTVYGPWQTEGEVGQGGVRNAYWWAYPDEEIPAGMYTVVDSDPGSWSQNDETDGQGVALVKGLPAE